MPALTPVAAARELNVSERHIHRLIGLGLLPASRVGGGQLRITDGSLDGYIERGSPNLSPTTFHWESGFPESPDDAFHAQQLVEKVATWLAGNAPAPSKVEKWANADPNANSFDYPASGLPDDLRAAFLKRPPAANPADAASWILRWGRHTLRMTAREVIRDQYARFGSNLFGVLYHSPEQFQAIERETFQRASTRPVLTSKIYPIQPTHRRPTGWVKVQIVVQQSHLFGLLPRADWTAATW